MLIHGDCLIEMKNIPDGSVDMVLTDPPYNINKADWDKWKTVKAYVDFMGKAFEQCQRILKDNGSFYFFHNDFLQIVELQNWINANTRFVFRRLIVWNKRFDRAKNKGFLDGFVETDQLRNYQKMAEYCLYYTFQDETGLSKIMGNCVYPIRDYIRSEIIKAKGKIILKDINTILGTATNGGGVASACLSLNKTCPAMITRDHYLILRKWLNETGEHEYLRKEYESLRYTFNNQKTHHSVWNYEIAKESRHNTVKPLKMLENIILHSTNPGDTVCDPFAGSGSTYVACIQTDRKCIAYEKELKYYQIADKRIKNAVYQEKLDL